MRIDQLEVTNFRCFEHLTLDLHPAFNVLIGDNGSGKTAILEAFAVAVEEWLRALRVSSTGDIKPDDVRLVGRSAGSTTTFEPQSPTSVIARGQIGEEPGQWIRTSWTINGLGRGVDAPLKKLAMFVAQQVQEGQSVKLPLVAYYGAGRLWPSDSDEEQGPLTQRELSRMEGYRDALTARASARELTRWLAYQDYVAYQEKRESPVYRAVLTAMRGMVEQATDVRFDAKRLEIVVEFEGKAVHPFSHLSDGQRNMLALAGDIAMRMARLNPQFDAEVLTETPGVVLIDELDLHLHPNWQRHVVEDLRCLFPKVQFITTTHSPQIIGELRPENILRLAAADVADKPFQSYGMDTNFILRHAMNTPDRDPAVVSSLSDIETLIGQEEYEAAQRKIEGLRAEVGEFADLVRLQTRIDRILILSR